VSEENRYFSMRNKSIDFETEEELQNAILIEKTKGISDEEIGKKYGVTFRYIEKLITKSQGINVSNIGIVKKIKKLYPENFEEEKTTVWSFKKRGSWATHSGEYRGNWSPYIPRNIILKYSKPGDLVLDYFCGAGTTAVEAKLLGRRCIVLDINDKAIELAKRKLNFNININQQKFFEKDKEIKVYEPELFVGDARNLSFISNDSIDLICSHPPYSNIIHYTNGKDGDLSFLDIDDFLKEMTKVAKESYRVLKPGSKCVILIGDTRRKKHIIPIGFKLMDVYIKAGFRLKELIIKVQHNCKTTGFWYENSIKYNFLLLAHEYLPVFEKPVFNNSQYLNESCEKQFQLIPCYKRLQLNDRLDKLEATTVWILNEKDFEESLNKNVICRYAKEDDYLIIILNSQSSETEIFFLDKNENKKKLLFIKLELSNNNQKFEINNYLESIKKIIDQHLGYIEKDGYVVIQAKDIRINGYIEPIAKRIVDKIKYENLWLKEIIIVSKNNKKLEYIDFNDKSHLKIVHQYILVYNKYC